jgi:hypothetical protein
MTTTIIINQTRQVECRPLPRSCEAIETPEALALQERCQGYDERLTHARRDLLIDNDVCLICKGHGGRMDYGQFGDMDGQWIRCHECKSSERISEYAKTEGDKLWESLQLPDEQIEEINQLQKLQDEYALSERLANGDFSKCGGPKGFLLEVYKGRKVPKGTKGVCFWVKSTRYGWRIGLRVEGQSEPVWVSLENCRVVFAS